MDPQDSTVHFIHIQPSAPHKSRRDSPLTKRKAFRSGIRSLSRSCGRLHLVLEHILVFDLYRDNTMARTYAAAVAGARVALALAAVAGAGRHLDWLWRRRLNLLIAREDEFIWVSFLRSRTNTFNTRRKDIDHEPDLFSCIPTRILLIDALVSCTHA
ncbi:hypothetical protein TMatcc_005975 [Talaromyces marneffei ATCC 18224]